MWIWKKGVQARKHSSRMRTHRHPIFHIPYSHVPYPFNTLPLQYLFTCIPLPLIEGSWDQRYIPLRKNLVPRIPYPCGQTHTCETITRWRLVILGPPLVDSSNRQGYPGTAARSMAIENSSMVFSNPFIDKYFHLTSIITLKIISCLNLL